MYNRRHLLLSALSGCAVGVLGGRIFGCAISSEPKPAPTIPADVKALVARITEEEITAIRGINTTRGFMGIVAKYPALQQAARCILRVQYVEGDGSEVNGSAICIGDDRFILCAHQVVASDRTLYPNINAVLPKAPYPQVPSSVISLDEPIDLALAQVSPPGIPKNWGLLAVNRNSSVLVPDTKLVSIGVFDGKLHAVEATVGQLSDYGKRKCKTEARSRTNLWGGMSGGGWFTPDGEFCGVTSSGIPGYGVSAFTPADAVWNFVAASYGKPINPSRLQAACHINQQDLIFPPVP